MNSKKIIYLFFCLFLFSDVCFSRETDVCRIPAQTGSISSLSNPKSDRLIYHIQDAHCQPEAQFNISNILDALFAHHKEVIVATEGACGVISAQKFREFPDKSVLKNVSKYLVDTGVITGSEFRYINTSKDYLFVGAEDPELYLKNHRMMLESLKLKDVALEVIDTIIDNSDSMFDRLNSRQAEFIDSWVGFRKGEIGFDKYVGYLARLISETEIDRNKYEALYKFLDILIREQQIDVGLVELQRMRCLDLVASLEDREKTSAVFRLDLNYKLQKISEKDYFNKIAELTDGSDQDFQELRKYAEFLEFSSSLDKSRLYSDIRGAVSQCSDQIFSSLAEKEILEFARYSYFYRELVSLELKSSDFDLLDSSHGVEWLKNQTKKLSLGIFTKKQWQKFGKAVSDAGEFYVTARKRDAVMISNLTNEMNDRDIPVGIIIAGGFHQDGIRAEVEKKGFRFCSITPFMKRLAKENRYFSVVKNLKTPFEQWVAGSTLAVASWISDQPILNREMKEVREQIFSSLLMATKVKDLVGFDWLIFEETFDEIVDKANSYLRLWKGDYAPQIDLLGVYSLGNKISIELDISGKKTVFIFSEFGIESDIVDKKDILESAKIGRDLVQVVTQEIANRIKQVADASQQINDYAVIIESAEKTFKSLGLYDRYNNDDLSIADLMAGFRAMDNTNPVSFSGLYDALQYLIAKEGDVVENLPAIELIDLSDDRLLNSDLIKLAYEFLKRSKYGENVYDVDSIPSNWQTVFKQRGISNLMIDPDVPFESLVGMLFQLVYGDKIIVADSYSSIFQDRSYQIRNIKLSDNTFFSRIVAPADVVSGTSFLELSQQYDDKNKPELKNGFVVIELDGCFALATVAEYRGDQKILVKTDIAGNIGNVQPGQRAGQLGMLAKELKNLSMDQGIIIRGVLFKENSESPRFFLKDEAFEQFLIDGSVSEYLPLKQGKWAESVGSLSANDFRGVFSANVIRISDVTGGYDFFQDLQEHIDLNGKNVLDVACQIGYNVFYSYRKGASFSAGIDINPYQIRMNREVSAYINEREDLEFASNLFENSLYDSVLISEGITNGQLFFRTELLKNQESKTGEKLSHEVPPNIDFSIADAREIPYSDDSFDLVTSANLLGYISGASDVLKEMIRVTKPGGIVKYNYAYSDSDNKRLLEETMDIFKSENQLAVTYQILQDFSFNQFIILRILDKKDILDIDADTQKVVRFTELITLLPNLFDADPYLVSTHFEKDSLPADFFVVGECSVDEISELSDILPEKKDNLIVVNTLLKNLYGDDIFDGVDRIRISRGKFGVSNIEDNVLNFDENTLVSPIPLFMELQGIFLKDRFDGVADKYCALFGVSPELVEVTKEMFFVYTMIQNFKFNLSDSQRKNVINFFRSYPQVDSVTHKRSLEFSALLIYLSSIPWDETSVIPGIVNFMYSAPEYKHIKSLLGNMDASNFVMASVVVENHERIFNMFETFLSRTEPKDIEILLNSLSMTILQLWQADDVEKSSAEWIDFIRYTAKLEASEKVVPDVLNWFLRGKRFAEVLKKYPNVGFYIIKDMIKTVINDESDLPDAPYLLKMSPDAIMGIIRNLHTVADGRPDVAGNVIENAMPILEALPGSAWIGPRLNEGLLQLGNGKPYHVINMRLDDLDQNAMHKKLVMASLLRKINNDDIVFVKLFSVDKSGTYNIFFVADSIGELMSDPSGAWNYQSNHLNASSVYNVAKKTVTRDFISLSKQLQQIRGIGSEFLAVDSDVSKLTGLGNVPLDLISHNLKLLKTMNRLYKGDLDFWNIEAMGDTHAVYSHEQKIVQLLFRLQIIDKNQLAIFSLDLDKKAITNTLDSVRYPQETNLDIVLRMVAQWSRLKARFYRVESVYKKLLPLGINEIMDDYEQIKKYRDLEQTTVSFLDEPVSIALERELLDNIDVFERNIVGYISKDKSGEVASLAGGIIEELDVSKSFTEMHIFFEGILSFFRIRLELRDRSLGAESMGVLLRGISGLKTNNVSDVLSAENPLESFIDESHLANGVDNVQNITMLFSEMFLFGRSDNRLSEMGVLDLFAQLTLFGFPVSNVFDNQKIIMESIATNPIGFMKFLSHVAYKMVDSPQVAVGLMSHLGEYNKQRLDFLFRFTFASDLKQMERSLETIVGLIDQGFAEYLSGVRNNQSSLSLLEQPNVTILPDKDYPTKMIAVLPEEIESGDGYFDGGINSLKVASSVTNWIKLRGVDSKTVTGRVGDDSNLLGYFVKIDDVVIGVDPFLDLFPTKQLVELEMVDAYIGGTNSVSLSNGAHMIWARPDEKDGLLFSGAIRLYDDLERKMSVGFFVDLNVVREKYTLDAITSYFLKVPKSSLYDLQKKLKEVSPDETMDVLEQYQQALFALVGESKYSNHLTLQKSSFNKIFHALITNLDPVWLLREKRNVIYGDVGVLTLNQMFQTVKTSSYHQISAETKELLLDAQVELGVDRDEQRELNDQSTDMFVFLWNDIPVGWFYPSQEVSLAEGFDWDEKPEVREAISSAMNVANSPFLKEGPRKKEIVDICSLSFDEGGNCDVNWNLQPDLINPNKYINDIKIALRDLSMELFTLVDNNISIKLVDGHWRLGHRQTEDPEGNVILMLDIDAFRNLDVLKMVLRHELEPHEGVFGEIKALIGDVMFFKDLHPDNQKGVIDTLKDEKIDLGRFSDILKNSDKLSMTDIVKDIIAYVSSKDKYPKLQQAISDMSPEEIALEASRSINVELSAWLESFGYDPFQILVLTTHPRAEQLNECIKIFRKFTGAKGEYADKIMVLPNALLGDKNEMDEFLNIVFDNHLIINRKDQFNLFSIFDVDVIPVLLKETKNMWDLRRGEDRVDMNNFLGKNYRILPVSRNGQNIIRVYVEKGYRNIMRDYSYNGELLDEQSHVLVNLSEGIPRAVSDMSVLADLWFMDKINIMIGQAEAFASTTDTENSKKLLDAMTQNAFAVGDAYQRFLLTDEAQGLYDYIPVSQYPLVVQYISDLIGSPMTSVSGYMELASMLDGEQKIETITKQAINLKEIRENIIRFRMIREYYIGNSGGDPMLIFPKTVALKANKYFMDISFLSDEALYKNFAETVGQTKKEDVFVVHFSGKNLDSLAWIKDVADKMGDESSSRIFIVSEKSKYDMIEKLLIQVGLNAQNVTILGEEVLSAVKEKSGYSRQKLSDVIMELIRANVKVEPANLILFSNEAETFGDIMDKGFNVLPLPGIKLVPSANPKKINHSEFLDLAA